MNKIRKVDFIIVGQGLAGTLLSHFLLKKGVSFIVLDDDDGNTSSKIAAGLINPITGRRFVKSWMIDELLPYAKQTYSEIEDLLQVKLFYQHNIVRALFNAGEENDWLARSAIPQYAPYIREPADTKEFEAYVHPVFSYSEVKYSARVYLALMIELYQKRLQQNGQWQKEVFDHHVLEIRGEGVKYKQWQAEKIVFCEGAKVKENPFFKYLPFTCDKGEILLVKIPNVDFKKIYKHKVYLIPYGENTYWVGASTQWEYPDVQPTDKGRKELLEKLDKAINVPYTVLSHKAAVRPTVRDRRPFIGQHPVFENLYLLNGFGTKGTSLAPYWINHFVDYLMDGGELSKEVDIRRYERYFE